MTKRLSLGKEWSDYISAHIEWVDGWISPGSEYKFKGPDGRVKLLQLILDRV